MKKIIKDKSFNFAVRIIKLYLYLKEEKREYTLSKQILRAGTSIGANIEEAIGGVSRQILKIKYVLLIKKPEKHITD
jgi:four helix bundle protein